MFTRFIQLLRLYLYHEIQRETLADITKERLKQMLDQSIERALEKYYEEIEEHHKQWDTRDVVSLQPTETTVPQFLALCKCGHPYLTHYRGGTFCRGFVEGTLSGHCDCQKFERKEKEPTDDDTTT